MSLLERIKKIFQKKNQALLGVSTIHNHQEEQTQYLRRIVEHLSTVNAPYQEEQYLRRIVEHLSTANAPYQEQRKYARYLNPKISLADLLDNATINVHKELSQRLDTKIPKFVYDRIQKTSVLSLGFNIAGDVKAETPAIEWVLYSLENLDNTNNDLSSINFSKFDFIYVNSNIISTILTLSPSLFYKMSSEVKEGLILDIKYDSSESPIRNDENNHIVFSLRHLADSTLHHFHYITLSKIFSSHSYRSSHVSTICCSKFSPNELQDLTDTLPARGLVILHRSNT